MDYLTGAIRYFSTWLSVDPSLFEQGGIFAVCSKERDQKLKGYGRRFPLYCFMTDRLAVLSYSETIRDRITGLTDALAAEFSVAHLKRMIEREFGRSPSHSRKYYFTRLPEGIDISSARQLTRSDYADFLAFHTAQYPEVDQHTWLEAYFVRIADQGYVFAVYEGGQIASATSAPDMPYLADLIVEPGIATLASFRRKGYAKTVTAALIQYLLSLGKVPIWSCAFANVGSATLAERVGYRQLGEVLHLSEG